MPKRQDLQGLAIELKAVLPEAQLIFLGYYNPFAALTGTAIAQLAPQAIQGLNAVIAGEATAFGAKFVDTYTTFLGKEASDTLITTIAFGAPNIHPTPAGYQLIGQQLAGLSLSPVPEPGSLALLGFGLAGLACRRLRRQAAAA